MARKSQAEIELAADTSEIEWVSMQEVALLLSVDVTTVRRWIGQGYLRARRFGPRLIRVDKATVCDLGDSVVWQGPLAS